MTQREEGFYWVRMKGNNWETARLDGGSFWCSGCEDEFMPEDFEEIGPRINPPEGVI